MKLIELAIGPEDFDRRWVLARLTLMGFGLEAGWAIQVGWFVAWEWIWPKVIGAGSWWDSWYLEFHHRAFYFDRIAAWWRACGWNAGRDA